MRVLGEVCLQLAFIGSGYSAVACWLADRRRWSHLRGSAVAAGVASIMALLVTLGVLAWSLLVKDFQLEYVAHYTSQLLPWHYSLSALWVGQAGSLLLWSVLLGVLGTIFLATTPRSSRLHRVAFGVVMAYVCFLVAIMVFAADPMKVSLTPRSEGLGLSPLLQHPSMLIHPPVVFLAYAAWTVPFALAVGALVTGDLSGSWVQDARRWALFAWTILGAGLLLGAQWAYEELGWGGYWGWDPVENGSLIPWLTGTAFIHTLMAWRHRGSLKKTACGLAVLTFALCNFATFLTRSGIFSSVHAFSESPIGWMFLALMSVLVVGGGTLIGFRRRLLAPDKPLVSLAARESLVLASTFLLLLLSLVVFIGTLFIPLSTMITGRTAQIGPSFYNNVLMPIAVLILLATSVVPLMRWGGAPGRRERRALAICGAAALAAMSAAVLSGWRHPLAIAVTGLTILVIATTASGSWIEASRYRLPRLLAVGRVWVTRRRQYAGYVIHLALACIAVGITGSSLGSQRLDIDLSEGQRIEWAGRHIEYVRLIKRELPDRLVAEVELRVSTPGSRPITLLPARHYFLLQDSSTTEVAIHSTWAGDFYTILHAGLGERRVAVTFIDNPLMRWIWCGGGLAVAGAVLAAWPRRRRRFAWRLPLQRQSSADQAPGPLQAPGRRVAA